MNLTAAPQSNHEGRESDVMGNEERTPRQLEVVGTERKKNKRIEEAMEALDDARKAKTKASNKHKEAEQRAIDAVKEEKLSSYTSLDLGMTITVDDTTHAKLSPYKPPPDAGAKGESKGGKSKEDF